VVAFDLRFVLSLEVALSTVFLSLQLFLSGSSFQGARAICTHCWIAFCSPRTYSQQLPLFPLTPKGLVCGFLTIS